MVRGRRNPLYCGLPSRLKKARQSLSFDSIAETAGLTEGNTVLNLERKAGHVPRLDTVEKVAYALGLSPAFLAYGLDGDGVRLTDGLRCEGVATRLREVRLMRELTMRALSEKSGLSHPTARSTETGASMPTLATVEALANALGVSPGWLAYGLGPVELPNRRATRPAASTAPASAK